MVVATILCLVSIAAEADFVSTQADYLFGSNYSVKVGDTSKGKDFTLEQITNTNRVIYSAGGNSNGVGEVDGYTLNLNLSNISTNNARNPIGLIGGFSDSGDVLNNSVVFNPPIPTGNNRHKITL